MKRDRLEDRLLDYLYGEMAPDERQAYEHALEGHPDLIAQVRGYRRVREAARGVEGPAVPEQALRNVLRQAREHAVELRESHERSRGFGGWLGRLGGFLLRPAVATAFLFLIVLGTGVLLVQRGEQPDLAPRSAEPRPFEAVPPAAAPAAPATEAASETTTTPTAEPRPTPPAEPAAAAAPADETEAAQPAAGAGAAAPRDDGDRYSKLGQASAPAEGDGQTAAPAAGEADGDAAGVPREAVRPTRSTGRVETKSAGKAGLLQTLGLADQKATEPNVAADPGYRSDRSGGAGAGVPSGPATRGSLDELPAAKAAEERASRRVVGAEDEKARAEEDRGDLARQQPPRFAAEVAPDRPEVAQELALEKALEKLKDAPPPSGSTTARPAAEPQPAREPAGAAVRAGEGKPRPPETAALTHGEPRPFPQTQDHTVPRTRDGAGEAPGVPAAPAAPAPAPASDSPQAPTPALREWFPASTPAPEPEAPSVGGRTVGDRTVDDVLDVAPQQQPQKPEETGEEEQTRRDPGAELLAAADAAFAAGRYADAAESYQRYLATDRASARAGQAQLRLAQAWQLQGRARDALTAYEEALRRHPAYAADPALLYQVGSLQLQFGRLDAAETNLRRVVGDPTWGGRARDLLEILAARRTDTGEDGAREKAAKPSPSRKKAEPAKADPAAPAEPVEPDPVEGR